MRAIVLAICFGHACAALVAADPIFLPTIPVHIMRGSVTVEPGTAGLRATASLSAPGGFQLSGGGEASVPCDIGCPAGEQIALSAAVGLRQGTIDFQGQTLEFDAFANTGSASLLLTGMAFTLPDAATSVSFRSPFRLEGDASVLGFLPPQMPGGDPVSVRYSFALRGAGHAIGTYSPLGDGTFRFESLQFDFAPVPEPGTIVLLATGITALGVRRRSRNHARPTSVAESRS